MAFTTTADFEGTLGADATDGSPTGFGNYYSATAKPIYSDEQASVGTQSAKLIANAGESNWGGFLYKGNSIPEGGEIWAKIDVYIPSTFNMENGQSSWKLLRSQVRDSAGSANKGYFGVNVTKASPHRVKFSNEPAATGEVDDLGPGIPLDTWVSVEYYVKLQADATGIIRVWQDGVLIYELTNAATIALSSDLGWDSHLCGTFNVAHPVSQHIYIDQATYTDTQPANQDAAGNYMVSEAPAYVYTHYADPAGTEPYATATSVGSPCSLEDAFTNATAGHVVGLLDGTYSLPANTADNYFPTTQIDNSGTAGNPIVFAAYTGATPILDGTKTGATNIGVNGNIGTEILGIVGVSYITLDGLRFTCDGGVNLAKIIIGDQNDNKTLDGSGYSTQNINVFNSEFYGGSATYTGNDNAEGIRIEGANLVTVCDCYFTDYKTTSNSHNFSGIKSYGGKNVVVENNEFEDNTYDIYIKAWNDNWDVRYNFCANSTGGIEASTGTWARNIHIYHNILYNHSVIALRIDSDGDLVADGVTGCKLYNNTVYSATQMGANPVIWKEAGATGSTGWEDYNNIYKATGADYGGAGVLIFPNGAWDVMDYNLYGTDGNVYAGGNRTSLATLQAQNLTGLATGLHNQNSLYLDPTFTNGNGDYSQPSDFALDTGSAGENADSLGNDMGANVALVGRSAASLSIVSASIDTAGTTLTITLSEAVTVTDYTGFTIAGHPMTGGAGSTTDTLTRTITTPVTQLDSPLNLVYTDQGANTVEATTGGVDLANNPSTAITNNSTVAVAPSWVTDASGNTVNENETVLITLSATGYPAPTYSIDGAGNDNAFVEILDSATGAVTLKTGSALDFDNPEATATPNVYVIDVKASNATDATRTVTIAVNNLAEAGAPTFTSGSIDANGTNMIWTFQAGEMLDGDNNGVYVTDINGDPINVGGSDVVVTDWGVAGAQPSDGVVHFTVAPPIPTGVATYAKFVNSEGTLRSQAFQTHVENFGPTEITNNSTVPASDTVAPVIDALNLFSIAETTVGLNIDSTESGGTTYLTINEDASAIYADVELGLDASGNASAWSGTGTFVAAPGYQNYYASGLLASTNYYAHACGEDAAGNKSAVTTVAFTTLAAAGVAPTVTKTVYSVAENQNAVPPLEADESPISWALTGSGTDNSLFEFVGDLGVLTLKTGNFDFEDQPIYNITVTPANDLFGSGAEAAIIISVDNTEVFITRPDPEITSMSYAYGSGGLLPGDAQIIEFVTGYVGHTSSTYIQLFPPYAVDVSPIVAGDYRVTFSAAEAEDVQVVVTVTEEAKKNIVYVGSGANATDSTGDGFNPDFPYATADAAKTFALEQAAAAVTFQDAGFHSTRVYWKANVKQKVYDASGNLAGTSGEVTFGTGGTYGTPEAAKADAITNSKKYVKCLTAGFYDTLIYVQANQTLSVVSE